MSHGMIGTGAPNEPAASFQGRGGPFFRCAAQKKSGAHHRGGVPQVNRRRDRRHTSDQQRRQQLRLHCRAAHHCLDSVKDDQPAEHEPYNSVSVH